jgi:hypothetical protein
VAPDHWAWGTRAPLLRTPATLGVGTPTIFHCSWNSLYGIINNKVNQAWFIKLVLPSHLRFTIAVFLFERSLRLRKWSYVIVRWYDLAQWWKSGGAPKKCRGTHKICGQCFVSPHSDCFRRPRTYRTYLPHERDHDRSVMRDGTQLRLCTKAEVHLKYIYSVLNHNFSYRPTLATTLSPGETTRTWIAL